MNKFNFGITTLKIPKGLRDLNFTHNRSKILTMDIETMDLNGDQIPIAISLAFFKETPNQEITTHFTLINKELLLINKEQAIDDLWLKFFNYFNPNNLNFQEKNIVIFMHNLGSFDGFFLYKGLLSLCKYNEVKSMIDKDNEFIQIEAMINGIKLTWKDSIRVFNVSLKELCKVFNVIEEGKLHPYNPEFNKLTLFDNPSLLQQFIKYAIQDSVALLTCLIRAQDHYIDKYQVDIGSIWSTATLSMKIFRTHFLFKGIECLTKKVDSFIRDAYYGGATDYYMKYGENLHHYDVNSLYPHAMLKPMPTQVKKFYSLMDGLNLNDFFGFFLVEIECPTNIKYPFIPFRDPNINGGGVIYPTGKWTGTYFSELLKFAELQGYKIKLIKGYSFYDEILFKEYVEHFYELKKNSFGSTRWIAKMHLNQLYGYFGRSLDLIQTENVN
jgi:DNA polymerase type B, organellar and viral